ncbi:polyamine ABC transporter substrate-binding protein [Succinatimonas hippei]|uniref:polyamine ABC transporter substrate-binding protein n=1 Tax=Succinatimonas hippei TaxID=626938 RepID=UPI002492B5BD|nr:polyamine ABC transporter substrate-binding protein [Succinatimonas hippei]
MFKKCMLLTFLSLGISSVSFADSNDLYIMNWSDYIAPDTIENFEKETGIKVHYSLIDSNEMLEAKLMAGNSGYDIITPSLHVLKRLGDAGLLLELDKNKLPNLRHLDKDKMAKIAQVDKDNTFGIPYMELSTGIGYNERLIKEVMGNDFKVDSWDVFFKPEILSKLNKCGATVLDSPSDMICTALIYLNKDPQSTDKNDYKEAESLLKTMIQNVTYMHSSQYANDLAGGEVCISVGWSGDIQLANQRSQEAGLDAIKYVIPKEGALMGYDMFAIPKDARNVNNAHLFLNYIMRPEVIADISNYVRYANANADATKFVDKEITNNPGIYYPKEMLERMHIVIPPNGIERILTKSWNRVRASAD